MASHLLAYLSRRYLQYSIRHPATPVGGRAPRCPHPAQHGRATPPGRCPHIAQGGAPVTDSCPPGLPKPHDRYDHYDVVIYTPYPSNIPRARRHVAHLTTTWGHPHSAGD